MTYLSTGVRVTESHSACTMSTNAVPRRVPRSKIAHCFALHVQLLRWTSTAFEASRSIPFFKPQQPDVAACLKVEASRDEPMYLCSTCHASAALVFTYQLQARLKTCASRMPLPIYVSTVGTTSTSTNRSWPLHYNDKKASIRPTTDALPQPSPGTFSTLAPIPVIGNSYLH